MLIAVAAGLVVLVLTGGILYLVFGRGESDEEQIRTVVDNFATAVDTQDQAKIISLLCADEAADLTDDDDYNPANDGGVSPGPGTKRTVQTSEVRVTGDTATARISRPGSEPATLSFRKEGGTWKVCAPAGDQPSPSAQPSPS